MNDMQIGGWMRLLPRAKASPGFTADVLRKVRQQEQRVPFMWRVAAAFAMAVCLVGIVHVAIMEHAQRERYAALRAEQQQLEAELEAVKKIASEVEPVVVLENEEGTRVIVDLDTAIQPASHTTYD
jgi:Tfp pilus assembly protein PilN